VSSSVGISSGRNLRDLCEMNVENVDENGMCRNSFDVVLKDLKHGVQGAMFGVDSCC
jgi:hypothetical protein